MTERFHRGYFEELYGRSGDPWRFATSEYEKRKYGRTLAALEGRRFRRALEAGCSIGVFTAMLAPYCEELLAVDTSERAVELARERLSSSRHVRVERRTLPEEAPEGPFDLIVASEFLYYLTEDLVLATLRRFEQELAAGGSLLVVHMRKEVEIYPLQGEQVHDLLNRHTRLANVLAVTEPEYRLDLFRDTRDRAHRRAEGRS
ncbi:MAG: nodulation S family protein [Actinomycetota bacterium]|nr:nodulation S family protein [Actinomycetota bacterium]